MRYHTTLLALLSAPLLTLAQQNPNPFAIPQEGYSASAGTPLDLNWDPTTPGTVTLVLRSGSSSNLNEGTVIASNIDNSGSYTWTPSESITRGSDYTVEIVSDDDPSLTNYTPQFVLDSPNTVASVTSMVTLGASATSARDLSTASPTGDATSVSDFTATSTATGMMTTMMTGMSSGGESFSCLMRARINGAANQGLYSSNVIDELTFPPSFAADSTVTSTATTGGTAAMNSASASASDMMSSASDAAASSGAASTDDAQAPEQSGNAGSRNTVVFGAVGGVLALAAAAL